MPFLLVGPWSGMHPRPTMTLRSDVMYGVHRDDQINVMYRISFVSVAVKTPNLLLLFKL